MALTVDTDSYISLEDADAFVSANYTSTETEFTTWDALEDADKEIYLRRACKKIDKQRFTGIKAVSTQALEFPRAIMSDYRREQYPALYTILNNDWIVQTETPQAVKDAQVEEALQLAIGEPQRLKLQRQGVKSFSLGSLSESYSGPNRITLISEEARDLLRPYLAGSAPII